MINSQNQFLRLILLVQLHILVLLFPLVAFGQEKKATVQGYLVDEQSGKKLTNILVVNQTSGDFVYGSEESNYAIEANKKDVLVFSALGYSSMHFYLRDSVVKSTYFVIPKLNKYSIIIKEVNVKADRAVTAITVELGNLTRSFRQYQQFELSKAGQFSNPISSAYNQRSKREISKRRVEQFKYLDRKRILLRELIRRTILSQTELLSEEEQNAFVEHLLKYDYKMVYLTQYELLAYINKECKKWMGAEDSYNVRSRAK
ncbi:hypothetical protein N9Q47_03575 [Vicingaceae bacterium]|nr:hypothetical protein [Vicingaceae bacterium]